MELQSKLSPLAAGLREKLGYPVTEGYGMIWLWLRGPITPPTFFTADTVRCGGTRYCLDSDEFVLVAINFLSVSGFVARLD